MGNTLKYLALGLVQKASELKDEYNKKSPCVICGKMTRNMTSTQIGCGYLCSDCSNKYSNAIRKYNKPANELLIEDINIIVEREEKKRRRIVIACLSVFVLFFVILVFPIFNSSDNKRTDTEVTSSPATESSSKRESNSSGKTSNSSSSSSSSKKNDSTSQKSKALTYSTNDQETAKNGNSGVFTYEDFYYSDNVIIDFDAGYVYIFNDKDDYCNRYRIESGDLNNGVLIIDHKNNDTRYWFSFKYKNISGMIKMWCEDDVNGENIIEFTTGSLNTILKKRDSKTIYDR